MPESRDELLGMITDIICEHVLYDREKISMTTDLRQDCRVWGDDGDEVLEAIDRQFEIDWTGLEVGIHFGSEGWGLPVPWQLRNSYNMFETQPMTVGDLVDAAESGKWKGTPVVAKPKWKQRLLFVGSIAQWGFLFLFFSRLLRR